MDLDDSTTCRSERTDKTKVETEAVNGEVKKNVRSAPSSIGHGRVDRLS